MEAYRTAALQHAEPVAKCLGLLAATMFENQLLQEEVITNLLTDPGQESETAIRHREFEIAHCGRRELCRVVQLELQICPVERPEKCAGRSSSRPRGEIPTI